jgi:hypothetical protein
MPVNMKIIAACLEVEAIRNARRRKAESFLSPVSHVDRRQSPEGLASLSIYRAENPGVL